MASFDIRHRTVFESTFVSMLQRLTGAGLRSYRLVSCLPYVTLTRSGTRRLLVYLNDESTGMKDSIRLPRRIHPLRTYFSCSLARKVSTRTALPGL